MTTAQSTTKTAAPSEQAGTMPTNFEQAYAELEHIVAQMESAQLPLDASLAAYQRGNGLLQFCQQALLEAEQQVQILNDRNQLLPYKNSDQ
jgi:exodeoxyribonuclease VII small subunit